MINLESVYRDVNSVLTDLLGKYTGLRFGATNEDTEEFYYTTPLITKGFYYKAHKMPEVGQIIELLRFVPENATIESAIKKGAFLDLIKADGSFLRFTINTIKQPEPPSYQWILDIKPNRQDTRIV